MSKYETHESRLRPTYTAMLAALGAFACQSGFPTLGATVNTLDSTVAAEALDPPVEITAVENQRAALVQQSMTDQALILRLNDALIFDPLLPPSEMSVAVEHGHVTLRGSVGTFFDGREAALVVSRSSGVSSVDNQLEVPKPGATRCLLGAP